MSAHTVPMWRHFVTSILWCTNSPKFVPNFGFVQRTERSHRSATDSNDVSLSLKWNHANAFYEFGIRPLDMENEIHLIISKHCYMDCIYLGLNCSSTFRHETIHNHINSITKTHYGSLGTSLRLLRNNYPYMLVLDS